MPAKAFLGMRGTGDWATNQRPEDWFARVLRWFPDKADAAMLSILINMAGKRKLVDSHFHFFGKHFPYQRVELSGSIFTDSALTTAYESGGAAGDTLYVKMAEADSDWFSDHHVVRFSCAQNKSMTVNAKVMGVTKAGANSYLAVKLLEADSKGVALGAIPAKDLSNADAVSIIGTAMPDGSMAPASIAIDVTEKDGYAQIFRDTITLTRRAQLQELRTGDPLTDERKDGALLHAIQHEKAFLWGIPGSRKGANNKDETYTAGLDHQIETNRFDFRNDGGGTWLANGEGWFDDKLEQLAQWGSLGNKIAICGSGALSAINKLAKHSGNFQLTAETKSYGIQVLTWLTAFGPLHLKTHPLLTTTPDHRNTMYVVEPSDLMRGVVTDTTLQKDIQEKDFDGRKDGWLTDDGLAVLSEMNHAVFYNMGLNQL